MMKVLERPRAVLEHQPEANHNDTLERDRMAAEQSTHTTPERWLPVPGYEGYYEVSDQGRVWSNPRSFTDSLGRKCMRPGRYIRPANRRDGRQHCVLTVHYKQDCFWVHRLVMLAFVGPRPENLEICHNNGDPSDNRLENLRYDTTSENHRDSVKHGTHYQAKKSHCPQGHKLYGPNLAPYGLRRGRRQCLACDRARSRVRYHKNLQSMFQELADDYYRQITREMVTNQ